jgi:hypothetical protein
MWDAEILLARARFPHPDRVETFVCAYLSIGASAITWAMRGVMTKSDSTTTGSQPPIQRRARLSGFPGENQGVVGVLHYDETGTKAHLNAHGPAGLPGMYTVEFVLAKPDARNALENEFRFADQRRGDSHLAIAKPAVIIDIDPTEVLLHFQSPSSPALVFHGFPNDAGYLAKLKSDVDGLFTQCVMRGAPPVHWRRGAVRKSGMLG